MLTFNYIISSVKDLLNNNMNLKIKLTSQKDIEMAKLWLEMKKQLKLFLMQ